MVRQTSDRRRARNRGRPLPDLPWLSHRLADEVVAPGPSPVPLAPDLVVGDTYARKMGLVGTTQLHQMTGVRVGTLDLWTRTPYWPPQRATGGRNERLYALHEVRLWLRWASQDPNYWKLWRPK
jgi:hypothetical protein